jgi:hypothetical protein
VAVVCFCDRFRLSANTTTLCNCFVNECAVLTGYHSLLMSVFKTVLITAVKQLH